MLRSHDILTENPAKVVEGYTRQCSLEVTVKDLAMMAATLANYGEQPLTGEQVVPKTVVRQVLSVMFTCGMYNAAGDWQHRWVFPPKAVWAEESLVLCRGSWGWQHSRLALIYMAIVSAACRYLRGFHQTWVCT